MSRDQPRPYCTLRCLRVLASKIVSPALFTTKLFSIPGILFATSYGVMTIGTGFCTAFYNAQFKSFLFHTLQYTKFLNVMAVGIKILFSKSTDRDVFEEEVEPGQ